MQFESLVFNADNWFVAQDILVNALDDDVILDSPYGSLLRVVALNDMIDVNITLLVTDVDNGIHNIMHVDLHTYTSVNLSVYHLKLCLLNL